MGYFSNGNQGGRYQSKWCDRCINWREVSPGDENWGCPVWDLHMDVNYDQDDKTVTGKLWKRALETFIPTGKDHWPQKCKMFFEKPDADIQGQMKMFETAKTAGE